MSILLVSPIGDVDSSVNTVSSSLETLKGKTVGYVFNQHISVLAFWRQLERIVKERLEPKGVVKVYKSNTWAPAATSDIDRIVSTTDFAVVGVGA
ncbi:MAG: hypothetical protein HY533_06410 [Chloroflexi bacterium]|nr:hypothetical protein [Chloroflexota bacterium]